MAVSGAHPAGSPRPEWLYSLKDGGGYLNRFDLLRPHHNFPGSSGLGNGSGLAVDKHGDVYDLDGGEVGVFDAKLSQPPKRTFTFADQDFAAYNIALDAGRHVYVSGGENSTGVFSIQVFAPDASGAVTPIREISGPATGISSPTGLALDTDGTLYVGNYYHQVLVFAPGATGNVAPIRTISGGLNYIENIALGADGNLYIACATQGYKADVVVFPKTANGDGPPLWTLDSGNYGFSMALGAGGTMYLGPEGTSLDRIAIFAPGASGKAKPIGFIGKVGWPLRLVLADPWFQP